jgi:hypothetical protein
MMGLSLAGCIKERHNCNKRRKRIKPLLVEETSAYIRTSVAKR